MFYRGRKREDRGIGDREGGESGRRNREEDASLQQPRICKLETVTPKCISGLLAHNRGMAGSFLLFPSHCRHDLTHLSGNVSSRTSEP